MSGTPPWTTTQSSRSGRMPTTCQRTATRTAQRERSSLPSTAPRCSRPACPSDLVQLVERTSWACFPPDLDGHRPPPPGTPDVFVKVDDNDCGYPADRLELWRFSVDFASPLLRPDLTGPSLLPTGQFDSSCNSQDLVQQPDVQQPGASAPLTTPPLDLLSDRLMFRASYRNFGTSQSLLAMHTVLGADRHAALRWYEIRFPDGRPVLRQQGTYRPDTDSNSRWLGSIAGDRAGDVAVGFSISGKATFPSIGYVGHAARGDLGTMDSGEGRLVTGAGSQTWFSGWGDYSGLTVDPVDRLHVLVHAGVLPGDEHGRMAHPGRLVPVSRLRAGNRQSPGGSARGDAREPRPEVGLSSPVRLQLPVATCTAPGESCSDIAVQLDREYTPGTLDVDTRLRVVVTGIDPAASASASSE